jgi:hypothetical protein
VWVIIIYSVTNTLNAPIPQPVASLCWFMNASSTLLQMFRNVHLCWGVGGGGSPNTRQIRQVLYPLSKRPSSWLMTFRNPTSVQNVWTPPTLTYSLTPLSHSWRIIRQFREHKFTFVLPNTTHIEEFNASAPSPTSNTNLAQTDPVSLWPTLLSI